MINVLVVDDAKSIRTLLAKCLELDGFSVEMAEDGKIALDMLLKAKFDLVFLDIKLPVISGTEVLRRMREKGIQIPVVIITAFGNIKNAIDCTRLGAVAYVQKPFTANRINAVLEELDIKSKDVRQSYMGEVKDLLEKEKFEDVQKILKNVLSGNPLDAEVYHMLAETSLKLGQPEDASQYHKLYEAIRKR
jgi:Response regulator containing CheY-like receiver, AAA-type ATPase, and DNA-binding domains